MKTIRIAVLISGSGTTLQNLIERVSAGRLSCEIVLVISSKEGVAGLSKAEDAGIPSFVVEKKSFSDTEAFSAKIFEHCREHQVDLVCMGGFLQLVRIPDDFTNRVMNVHPTLIPSFCGQGFHGGRAHKAVLEKGVKVSGCTVHFADNIYDHGPIIVQRAVPVLEDDDVQSLAARVFEQECEAYPEAIQLFAEDRLIVEEHRVRILPPS